MKKIHASSIAGAIVAAGSAYELHHFIQGSTIDRPVFWGLVALFGLGMFLMFPTLIGNFAKTVIVFVPKLSFGSRESDVPIQAAPPGTKPGDPVLPAVVDEDKPK